MDSLRECFNQDVLVRSVEFGIAEAVADRVDRDVLPAHLALRRCVAAVIRKILDLVEGMNLLAEYLCGNGEDRRDSYNSSSVVVNTLACAQNCLAGSRGC